MARIDQAIEYFFPAWGLRRVKTRTEIRLAKRKYEAADLRRTKDWVGATGAGPVAELASSLRVLRNRSRDLVRNNVYYRKMVQTLADEIVGEGIQPAITGVSKKLEAKLMEAWNYFVENCDWDGEDNFKGIQGLIAHACSESGEVIVLKRYSKDKRCPIQIEVVEADHIDDGRFGNMGKEGGNTVRYGIEFDDQGKKTAYYLWDNHPGESMSVPYKSGLLSRRVSIDAACHVYWRERPKQLRGAPWGVAVMLRLRDLGKYEEYALIQKKVQACYTAFIHDIAWDQTDDPDDDPDELEYMEPGRIESLPSGRTVTMATPPTSTGHGEFVKANLQGAAAGGGVTYEAVTSDLSNTNYSSGRMGHLQMGAFVTTLRARVMWKLLSQVWGWFLEGCVLQGIIDKESQAGNVEWIYPRRAMLDAVKETNAIRLQLEAGLISYPTALRQLGQDYEKTIEEMKKSKGELESAGIELKWTLKKETPKKK